MFIVFRFTDFLSEKNPRLTGAKRPALLSRAERSEARAIEQGRTGK